MSINAVRRWVTLGYVQSVKERVEGTTKRVHFITGGALADFFAARKEHQKGVAERRDEREAKAAARAGARQDDEAANGA